jgi:hypothetical protein
VSDINDPIEGCGYDWHLFTYFIFHVLDCYIFLTRKEKEKETNQQILIGLAL